MHIYAFGSICRGEIKIDSDIDLLAITNGYDVRFDPDTYSIYSYKRISELWREGNPFSWHLASESKLIYSSSGNDFINELGSPSEYKNCQKDCLKFYNLFLGALASLSADSKCVVFELSSIFLAIRNFATCFSLGMYKVGIFSRDSALRIGEKSLRISQQTYNTLESSRVLSTRGKGDIICLNQLESCLDEIGSIKRWMEDLIKEINRNG